MFQSLSVLILFAFAACASDGGSEFPAEGPESVASWGFAVINSFDRAVNDAWLANHATADHNDPRTDGGVYREPLVAFLRWQLRDDSNGEAWFVRAACVLCADASWSLDVR